MKRIFEKLITGLFVFACAASFADVSSKEEHHNHFGVAHPLNADATETITTPSLSISSYNEEILQDNSYYFTVRIANPTDISSLQLLLTFDNEYVSISSLSNYVSDSIFDYKINEDSVSITYVFTTTLTEDANLFYFWINVPETATTGTTYLDLAVLDANNSSLETVTVNSAKRKLTIKENAQRKYCSFDSSVSKISDLRQGDEVVVTYSSYYLNNIAAGDFVVKYDRDVLEYVSHTKLGFLNDSAITFNINSDTAGSISFSFISSNRVSQYEMISLLFKVKNNETTSTDIEFKSTSICDFSYNDYQDISITNTINTIFDKELVIKKKMYISGEVSESKLMLIVQVEENANFASGNFKINFPTEYFSYSSYSDIRDKNKIENLIVNTTKAKNGEIDFYIFNINNNITTKENVLSITLFIDNVCNDFATSISIYGDELCDLGSNAIELDHPSYSFKFTSNGHSPSEAVRENEINATCESGGSYDLVVYCSECGAEISREAISVPAKGHEWGDWSVSADPTCTESGTKTRECSACGKSESEMINALGHDLTHHEGKAATCMESGYYGYDECSRCGYSTYSEIPAKGHQWDGNFTIDKESTCTEKGEKSVHCSACGERKDITEVPAKGHQWGEWTENAESTVETRSCTQCGKTETRQIERNNNNDSNLWPYLAGGLVFIALIVVVGLLVTHRKKR